MLIRRGFKVRLKSDASIEMQANLFSGHRRFVYNYFLTLNLKRLEDKQPIPNESGTGYERNNAKAKSGLSKSILDVGWNMFSQFLEYKQASKGGFVAYVPAHHTSQKCPKCGHTHSDNRQTQARFVCRSCGFQANADLVGSINIETRGRAGQFAHKSHASSPEMLDFSRGLACSASDIASLWSQEAGESASKYPFREHLKSLENPIPIQ